MLYFISESIYEIPNSFVGEKKKSDHIKRIEKIKIQTVLRTTAGLLEKYGIFIRVWDYIYAFTIIEKTIRVLVATLVYFIWSGSWPQEKKKNRRDFATLPRCSKRTIKNRTALKVFIPQRK